MGQNVSVDRPVDVSDDHLVHPPCYLGLVGHDVVTVVDTAHLDVFGERADRLELVRVSLGFIAQSVELCGYDQCRCDTCDAVGVVSPCRRDEPVATLRAIGRVGGVEHLTQPGLQDGFRAQR